MDKVSVQIEAQGRTLKIGKAFPEGLTHEKAAELAVYMGQWCASNLKSPHSPTNKNEKERQATSLCPDCGCSGPHYCTGKPMPDASYSGAIKNGAMQNHAL